VRESQEIPPFTSEEYSGEKIPPFSSQKILWWDRIKVARFLLRKARRSSIVKQWPSNSKTTPVLILAPLRRKLKIEISPVLP